MRADRVDGASARISLSLANVDVRDALVRVAQYAQVDVMLAPGATGNVSVSLRDRTPDEAIRMIAAAAGLSMTKTNGAYLVGPASEIKKAAADFGIVEIVSLQYLASADAVDIVGRLVPAVKAESVKSAVVLSGQPDDIRTAREAIARLDVKPEPVPVRIETRAYVIKSGKPDKLEDLIRQVHPGLTIAREDRSLVLTGPTTDLDSADKTISAIDVDPPKEPETKEYLVYKLKYLNATKVEETMKKAFPSVTVVASPEPNTPPMAMFNPLTSSTLAGSTNGSGSSGSSGSMGGGGMGGGMGGGGTGGGMGGGAGQGSQPAPFSRSSSVILSGPKGDLEQAKGALEALDTAQPMVRSEAVMVETAAGSLRDIGLTWGYKDGGFSFSSGSTASGSFTSGTDNPFSWSAALTALVTRNKARVLTQPNITVVNYEDASIFIGKLLRYRGAETTTSTTGAFVVQSVESAPVGVALLIRPNIHPDGNVTLKVHPVVSTATFDSNGLPQTSSREADTTVRLRPGEELVIGGLETNEVSSTVTKTPLLGDIPIIGELFKKRHNTSDKTEVVVLIRCYPVMPDTAPGREFKFGMAKP